MFPIPWNKAYRKKDGGLTIIDDMFIDAPELQEEIDALDDRLDTAEGNITSLGTRMTAAEGNITSLGTRMTAAEGKISNIANTYLLLGSKGVTLATADGNTTCDDLMTAAMLALRAINPSSEVAGATHMKLLYFGMPYGDAADYKNGPIVVISPIILADTFTTTTVTASKLEASSDNSTLIHWFAQFSSNGNKWFQQRITNGAITDFVSRKPSNGTTLVAMIEFYAKQS